MSEGYPWKSSKASSSSYKPSTTPSRISHPPYPITAHTSTPSTIIIPRSNRLVDNIKTSSPPFKGISHVQTKTTRGETKEREMRAFAPSCPHTCSRCRGKSCRLRGSQRSSQLRSQESSASSHSQTKETIKEDRDHVNPSHHGSPPKVSFPGRGGENKWVLAFWALSQAPPRSGSNWEGTRAIREWASWVPLAVTTDVTPLGKYESLASTTPVLGERPQGSQSVQTSGLIATRQCRSSQRCQRDGFESIEEEDSRHAWHTS